MKPEDKIAEAIRSAGGSIALALFIGIIWAGCVIAGAVTAHR
jgi:hypothetical protein